MILQNDLREIGVLFGVLLSLSCAQPTDLATPSLYPVNSSGEPPPSTQPATASTSKPGAGLNTPSTAPAQTLPSKLRSCSGQMADVTPPGSCECPPNNIVRVLVPGGMLACIPQPKTSEAPVPATPAPKPCKNNERLDSGCECESDGRGACFDICCTADAGCAHPLHPGGPSACMLMPMKATPPSSAPAPVKPAPTCKDGEFLSSGCTCKDTTCMDICCVGSACSHHSSPEGGWPKCMSIPKSKK